MEVIKEEKNVKTAKLILGKEEIKKAEEKVYSDLSKNIKLKGFRPGRVPRNLLTTVVGKEKINDMIKEELADMALDKLYADEEFKKLNLMLPPALISVDVNDNAEVIFELHSYPEVKIGSLKGEKIEIPQLKEEDLEKDVEGELQRLREENAVLEPKAEDEPVEVGDHVEIEYRVNDGDEAKTFDFVVKEPLNTELLQKIVGKKIGESFEITDDKTEEKTVYSIKVTAIHKRMLAKLDDEFAKTVDEEAETLEALKNKLRAKIKGSFDDFMKTFEMSVVLDKLADKTELNISEHSLELFINHVIMRQKEDGEYEKSLREFNGDEKAYRESLKKEVVNYLKVKRAVEKIANEKGINVSEDEIFEKAKEYYKTMNISDERLKVALSKDKELHDRIRNEILHDKVAQELLKEVEIVIKEEAKETEEKKEKREENADE